MKKFIFPLLIMLLSSCKSDDDGDSKRSDGLILLESSKEFLLDEKWFLESAFSETAIDINNDGNATKDLISQVPACDLDSYYQFEQSQPNIVVLIEGENECIDSFDRFLGNAWNFELKENNKLFIELRTSELLGGIKNTDGFNRIDGLFDTEFLISPDSKFKIIKGTIQNIINTGSIVNISYSLKANINDRP